MHTHIALYGWRPEVTDSTIARVLAEIESLQSRIPGITEISTGINTSPYSEGYTHVILVRGESLEAINAYRAHVDHQKAAKRIVSMEERSVGIDFHN
jgi:hypothetical protein